ncbi:MAG: hypothetical protein QW353_07560 [Candidatus Korarchaeum sp.]
MGGILIGYAIFSSWFAFYVLKASRFFMGERDVMEFMEVSSMLTNATSTDEIVEALSRSSRVRDLLQAAIVIKGSGGLVKAVKDMAHAYNIPQEFIQSLSRLDKADSEFVRSLIHDSSLHAFSMNLKLHLSRALSKIEEAMDNLELLALIISIAIPVYYFTTSELITLVNLMILSFLYLFLIRPIDSIETTYIFGYNFKFKDIIITKYKRKEVLILDLLTLLLSLLLFKDPSIILFIVSSVHMIVSAMVFPLHHIVLEDLGVLMRRYSEFRLGLSQVHALNSTLKYITNPVLRDVVKDVLSEYMMGKSLWREMALRLPFPDLRPIFLDFEYIDHLSSVDAEEKRRELVNKIEKVINMKMKELDEFFVLAIKKLLPFSMLIISLPIFLIVGRILYLLIASLGGQAMLSSSFNTIHLIPLMSPALAFLAFSYKKVSGELGPVWYITLSISVVGLGLLSLFI